jgi:hypothetical protein
MDQALQRIVDELRRATSELLTSTADISDDAELLKFHLDAAAGAAAYGERVQDKLNRGDDITEADLYEADMVARAAAYGGWITASTVAGSPSIEAIATTLIEEGVFAYFPQVPGKWVACYRILAP